MGYNAVMLHKDPPAVRAGREKAKTKQRILQGCSREPLWMGAWESQETLYYLNPQGGSIQCGNPAVINVGIVVPRGKFQNSFGEGRAILACILRPNP